MARLINADLSVRVEVRHETYVDEAELEAFGYLSELQDAGHGHHELQTRSLSRRELDRARDQELLRISLLGPTM